MGCDLEAAALMEHDDVQPAWEPSWMGAQYATPDDYAKKIAHVLARLNDMGELKDTVIVVPRLVDFGMINSEGKWQDATIEERRDVHVFDRIVTLYSVTVKFMGNVVRRTGLRSEWIRHVESD